MANEEVLGPRKTMFVLVIVVGCFAVLWPRILSPLLVGHTQEQLKPNKFDREAGCCEVMFASEVAVLEVINEVCNTIVQGDLKSPYAAAECRKYVNETCGVDIAAFLKRSENVGKTTKILLDTMKSSNSSCLKEHFGVPVSLGTHFVCNSWTVPDTLKQERPSVRGVGPHPALRERGRAIPPGVPTPPSRGAVPLPPHVRPPPIPGMRPPLGSPGGPVTAPKSSMGFVMPIYTICIIVFFVYTLSKILFKRTGGSPYESLGPDPQFRRRVFRDDSRTSPDKLVVTAISGLVAEVQQQMEASYAQNQQRQEVQDNHTRPYTNGTILHNSGPVHIVASEYRDPKEKTPEAKEKESSPEPKESSPEPKESSPEPKETSPEPKESAKESSEPSKEPSLEPKEFTPEPREPEPTPESEAIEPTPERELEKVEELSPKEKEATPEKSEPEESGLEPELEPIEVDTKAATEEFLSNTKDSLEKEKKSTPELLEEALKEDNEDEEEEEEEEEDDEVPEKSSVKVVGMELSAQAAAGAWRQVAPPAPPAGPQRAAHEADQVKSIFLETEIPQQSRVLVADFAEDRADRPKPTKHSPMVVSGKMTLSLIQDEPRETPERDAESTVDDFTTASGVTQPAAEKDEELSDEEIEEEIEIEEIEEEVEEEEEEEPAKVEKKPEAV